METKDHLKRMFAEGVKRVNPAILVKEYMQLALNAYDRREFSNLIVVGFGKAAYQMACAAEDVLGGDLIKEGVVITKYGHSTGQQTGEKDARLDRIRVLEAAHPIPDENGMNATEEIISLLRDADDETLVLCLISGGGSALLVNPYEGVSLRDKQEATSLIMNAGADIHELNAVRKHMSMVKGGRLAEIASPASILSLIISDVIGDRLDVIASGPTSPDDSTYSDALGVIARYNLTDKIPVNVRELLERGREGSVPDTPGEDNPVFDHVENMIIGNIQMALKAARDEAERTGYTAEIVSSEISGEARDAGKLLGRKARELKAQRDAGAQPEGTCLISGGETTVTVTGSGIGGRNTELALSFAMEIEGVEGVCLLSAGTDGNDGPTDAAGAVVDGYTVKKAREMGMDPESYLQNNDSYSFFRKTDSLLLTGPTGTNVMDLQILLVE